MVFSKPIIPFATMLLAAQMVAAGRSSDMTDEDLTFVKAPPARGPEVSSWLASKAAAAKPTSKPATKTSKTPARRTAEVEVEFDGEVIEADHSVSIVVVPTPEPTMTYVDDEEVSEEDSSDDADADADEEVTQLYARFVEEPSSRSGRVIAKSRIVDEDASPFLDEAEDPEDGSWGKRDRPAGGAGYGGGQGKPAGQGEGQGYGGGQGQGMGPGGKQGGGMGQGRGRGNGQGKGAHQEGGAKGGKQDYGNNMKRFAPNHGSRNGTTTDRPQRPNFAPSGVRPSGTKPTGSMPAGAGFGSGGPGGKGPRPTATM